MPIILRKQGIARITNSPSRPLIGTGTLDLPKEEAGECTPLRRQSGRVGLACHLVTEVKRPASTALVLPVDSIPVKLNSKLHCVGAADVRETINEGAAKLVPVLVVATAEVHRHTSAA